MREPVPVDILAAGAVAAFTVDVLVYPLDTIKTRYQSQGSSGLKSQLSCAKQAPYTAMRGMYQGIGSVVLATLPAAAVFFASYESGKSALLHMLPAATPGPVIHAFASAGAEMASCFVLTPAEVIKQNAQVLRRSPSSSRGRSSSLEALDSLRRREGGVRRTLWRGYTALVARNLPFTSVQFPMFEFLRGWIWKLRYPNRSGTLPWAAPALRDGGVKGAAAHTHTHDSTLSSLVIETGLVNGVAASLSGCVAATVTTPADVVKTRVMLGLGNTSSTRQGQRNQGHPSSTRNSLDVARTVLRESGVRGLFRGALLRATWAALGSGLYLGSYEATKIWLRRR